MFAQCNIAGGVVLDDGPTSGELDSGDHFQKVVRVNLFRDNDCDGAVGSGDILVDVQSTGANGLFEFEDVYTGEGIAVTAASSVVSSDNDAEENLSTGQVDKQSANLDFGNLMTGENQIVGLRFTDVGIPFGAVVSEAVVRMNASSTGQGSTTQVIVSESSADSQPIDSGNSTFDLSERLSASPSIASVEWGLSAANWQSNTSVSTPDISEIVQELVNTPGWKVSSPIMLLFKDPGGASGNFRASSGGNANIALRPTLELSWELGNSSGCFVIEPDAEDLPENASFVNGSSRIALDLTGDNGTDGVCSSGNFLAYTGNSSSCYVVAERPDELRLFNRNSGFWETVGTHGTQEMPAPAGLATQIEAIAMGPAGNIYTANTHTDDLGYFGSLNGYTGEFSASALAIGSGEDAAGVSISFTDVDALTFNPETGIFWGMQNDKLIRIDPATGQLIPNSFGAPGKDYIRVKQLPENQIDDIAIDPETGVLYAINNKGGAVEDNFLVTIDVETGIGAVVASIKDADGNIVTDFEGLGFSEDGQLYGVTGEQSVILKDRAFRINKLTGEAEIVATFTQGNSDMEGCACRLGEEAGVTNPDDLGTEFEGSGPVDVVNTCDDFIVQSTVLCAGSGNIYQVIISFAGGSPGADGYTVIDNLTGSMTVVATGDVFSSEIKENGTGFSFNAFVSNNPECLLVEEQSMIDCQSTAVELIDFSGRSSAGGNIVTWTTGSENESDYFELESSKDGMGFTSIAKKKATGFSNSSNTYSFLDRNHFDGTYYRLSEVDFQGNRTSFQVIFVESTTNDLAGNSISVFPTLVENQFAVTILDDSEFIKLRLFDLTGALIEEMQLDASTGSFSWNIEQLKTGIYIVDAQAGSKHSQVKIFKQ